MKRTPGAKVSKHDVWGTPVCLIEDQVSMQGRGSGGAMATGRGSLEP